MKTDAFRQSARLFPDRRRSSAFHRVCRRRLVLPALALTVLLAPAPSRAQLGVGLQLVHSETLQHETVWVVLRLHNQSAEPFVVARDVDNLPELTFEFTRRSPRSARRFNRNPILRNIYLLPGEKKSFRIPLNRWYSLTDMGQYIIQADIVWNGLRYRSNRAVLNVVRGLSVAQAVAPVPGVPGESMQGTLRYWMRGRQEHLFLVVENVQREISYGVFPLGPVVRTVLPKIEMGPKGVIRIVHQFKPRCFAHSTFEASPAGINRIERSFRSQDGGPCISMKEP